MSVIPPRVRATLIVVGKIAISLSLFALVATKVDFPALLTQWRLFDLLTIAISLAILLVEVSIIAGLRVKLLLEALSIQRPLGALLQVVMSGFFFEQIAFGFLGGDTMRFLQMRRLEVPGNWALATIVTDRLLGMLGLVALAALGLPDLMRLIWPLDHHIVAYGSVCALSVVAAAACLVGILGRFRRVTAKHLAELSARLRESSGWQKHLLCVFCLAILTQMLNIVVFALLGRALHLNLTVFVWLFVVPPVLLVSMLPISAGGWGVREASLTLVLGNMGVAPDKALAVSLMLGFLLIVVTLPGGFTWLAIRRRSRRGKADPLGAASDLRTPAKT